MEKPVDNSPTEVLELLIENKCLDCQLHDLRDRNWFVDYAVIGTYTSQSHLNGVARYLDAWMTEKGIVPMNQRPKYSEKWFYWDCGTFVINLMDTESRAFYSLEDLWFKKTNES